MKAYLTRDDHLMLLLTGETPEELLECSTLSELVSVYFPKLREVAAHTIGAHTRAPIFTFEDRLWYFPQYLTVDAVEYLRDNGRLQLTLVE